MRHYFILAFLVLSIVGCNNTISIPLPPPTPSVKVVQPLETDLPTTYVIVALGDIKKGSPFMGGFIGRREWRITADLPLNLLTDETQVISQVAKIDIVQGQLLTWDMLMPEMPPTPEGVQTGPAY